jgi:hypothetical protein
MLVGSSVLRVLHALLDVRREIRNSDLALLGVTAARHEVRASSSPMLFEGDRVAAYCFWDKARYAWNFLMAKEGE